MKLILGVMLGFYILTFWIFPFIYKFLFPWGGVSETHLHPIYMGMILLSGIIVACTKVILEAIKDKKNKTG
jgi:hypothetical protein